MQNNSLLSTNAKFATVRKNRTVQHKVAGAFFAYTIQCAAIKE